MRAFSIFVVAVSAGCASPASDPGDVAREERPRGHAVESVHDATDKPPAARLRETKSLGYAGDGKLTEVPPRREPTFEPEGGGAPLASPGGAPPIVVYGGAPYGGAPPRRSASPAPPSPASTSSFFWTQATAPGGSMPAATPPPSTPSVPFAPK